MISKYWQLKPFDANIKLIGFHFTTLRHQSSDNEYIYQLQSQESFVNYYELSSYSITSFELINFKIQVGLSKLSFVLCLN